MRIGETDSIKKPFKLCGQNVTRSIDVTYSRSNSNPASIEVVTLTSSRLLVPVSESRTLRNTVAYVVQEALERATETGSSATIHFVYPLSERLTYDSETKETETAHTLLDRVAVWAEEDLGDNADDVTLETTMVGAREYLFSPADYADVFVRYARDHDLDCAVFDPGFNPIGTAPLLPPLEAEVRRTGLSVEEAPVQRERRSPLLVKRGTLAQFFSLFSVSYLFYLLLAGSLAPFELATGAITASIVAVSLWGISLTTPVHPIRTIKRLGRFALYIPYLLWQIVKANVEIARVVLHPDLPIDPKMVEFDAAVWSELPVTTLANSITLTPGTLTVDVSRRHFTVHTLTGSSREDLFDGSLERAVRFVFYGLSAARIPSPVERMDRDEEDTR
ncbi:multisubunit sodium/proton antiporter, MrpE subunit [Haladaptatus litoreus]|uniref:Multisubunit sodium/proton antiporter, MrpE subunit n=1 Tax=Haladaptatus litoreus TaxID=553468 RepID=A0A1N7E8H4_9EURY|nr:monovalent cation/H+ antiporter subunit E [Haladaptatus litoreus]SIR84329.1 multisubunit sodium/proton antiporter, MrpE subunit [Haladaptatus litoreus]